MSQKHAVAIFVASFVAGLLATVVLFEPHELPAPPPFFGFADEANGDSTAEEQPIVSPQPFAFAPPQPAAPAPVVPSPVVTGHDAAPPPADHPVVLAIPPQPQAEDELPSATLAASDSQSADNTAPVAARMLPQPMALSEDEIHSLEQLVQRTEDATVAVMAFSEQPDSRTDSTPAPQPSEAAAAPSAPSDDTKTTSRATPPPVPAAFEPSAAMSVSSDADSGTTAASFADPEGSHPTKPQAAPQPRRPTLAASEPTDEPQQPATVTQGHVGTGTVVESPDSLRALVTRTRPEATPEPAPELATAAPAPGNAEQTAAPEPSQNLTTRSQATAKGLQSAAAALERVEAAAPVKSLLTRTLGPTTPAPAPPQPAASRSSVIQTEQAWSPANSEPATTASLPTPTATATTPPPPATPARLPEFSLGTSALEVRDELPYPQRWDKTPEVSLTPRHPRQRTTTAPLPPLRTDLIGKAVVDLPRIRPTAGESSARERSWVDPDRDNWSKAVTNKPVAVAKPVESPRERIVRRLSENSAPDPMKAAPAAPTPPPDPASASKQVEPPEAPVKRLLERLRPTERIRDRLGQLRQKPEVRSSEDHGPQTVWPPPTALLRQLDDLAVETSPRPSAYRDIEGWIAQSTDAIERVLATHSFASDAAGAALGDLSRCVPAGLAVADSVNDEDLASQVRRVAFAINRRSELWQAATALAATPIATVATTDQLPGPSATVANLLAAIEQFESDAIAPHAAAVQLAAGAVTASTPSASSDLLRAISHQYAAPNLRISLRETFLTRLMPKTTRRTEGLNDTVLGRPVRGRRELAQTTSIRLVPDSDELCFTLTVDGELNTYGITDAGPISLTSSGSGSFTVWKPVKICPDGLLVGPATASASNRARLMDVSTSFDSVPLMGSLLRTLAKNQHAENLPEANREVAQKIVWQSCRQCNREAEEKFAELSKQVEENIWNPLVGLGLAPTPFMETTDETATLRLRLHADNQLAAHTPRPREPTGALFGMQVHQSTLNNAFDRLGIAGEKLSLEALFIQVQERLGREPKLPDDLPEGVTVTFEAIEPIRVEFADGLVNVKLAIDALESGRRDWYDVIGQVCYKPVAIGNRVLLEREGPIRISGPGHRGRIEFALRTIFGKIFPKERPLVVLPAKVTDHPGLRDLVASQAVSWDGWLALALSEPLPLNTAAAGDTPDRR